MLTAPLSIFGSSGIIASIPPTTRVSIKLACSLLRWDLTVADAEALRVILLEVVQTHEAQLDYRDAYGQRYTVDFWLNWQGKRAQVRSAWILEYGSMTPRLTSCYGL